MHEVFDAVLGTNLLHANQHLADHNRAHFDEMGVFCVNLMSGPGAGKTSLLEKALVDLKNHFRVAVIEGDMTTQLDAERLRATGVPVIAINTGRACHLDAKMVHGGLHLLAREASLDQFDLLIVENVGNLVCPAEFEVGEHCKIALLSITEGEDKPLKYPLMFHEADCVVVTKLDLAPYLDFDRVKLEANLHEINPEAPIFWVSSKNGSGLGDWLHWLAQRVYTHRAAQPLAVS
ncbi:hydrogenase nickel incorporation protein HypB [Anthocerotibacter panamensis]|uniref:hydrogenase nickel incorporation protein HypB n=1 Tax=Anthocerotibacter panamensis TaxID=2857077 RepID=UPI001C4052DD|nr:hydrogenase nickel incorporation protein HypB [Anthocerotibacter panamensis]